MISLYAEISPETGVILVDSEAAILAHLFCLSTISLTLHFLWKLLHDDPDAASLIEYNPFPDSLPTYVRVQYYRYEFLQPWENKCVWNQKLVGTWMLPLSTFLSGFQEFIETNNRD